MSEEQKKLARAKAGRIIRIYKETDFILDDESYNSGSTTLAGNNRFYSLNVRLTKRFVRHKEVTKHEKKVLV